VLSQENQIKKVFVLFILCNLIFSYLYVFPLSLLCEHEQWTWKFTVVLSGNSPLKVPIIYFDLEPSFGYAMFKTKIGGFISKNYEKTLVIKVSKITFSKSRDKEYPTQGQLFTRSTNSAVSIMSWARTFLSCQF
jgi:hypothetical protein